MDKIIVEPEHEMDLITWQKNRITELEVKNKQLKDWIGRSLIMSDYPNAEAMRVEIEHMRKVEE
jgi:hypothetical protein